tara:strand:- start:294 stop:536 length:243 start_codon:yes stop_codon:yes gene_type:complete
MFIVVWDNGLNATGAFPHVFETWEGADAWGKDWADESNTRDDIRLDDGDGYSYDVVEIGENNGNDGSSSIYDDMLHCLGG